MLGKRKFLTGRSQEALGVPPGSPLSERLSCILTLQGERKGVILLVLV